MNRQHKIEKPDERLNLDFTIDFQFFELHLFDSRVYSKQFLFPLVFRYSYLNLQLFDNL